MPKRQSDAAAAAAAAETAVAIATTIISICSNKAIPWYHILLLDLDF
jgi:hypothetical protein